MSGENQSIEALRQALAQANELRATEYKTRLALAMQCKALRDALKEALEALEAVSYDRYRGVEAKCLAALELSARLPEQVIAESGKAT